MKKNVYLIILSCFCVLVHQVGLMATSAEQTAQQPEVISEPNYEEIYEAGSYPIVLEYEDTSGNKLQKTIYVTITFKQTVENQETKEAIDAHDIILKKGTLKELSDEQLLYLTRAKAWIANSNQNVPVKVLKRENNIRNRAYHELTIGTEKGTTTTIHIYEVEAPYTSTLPQYFDAYKSWRPATLIMSFIGVVGILLPMVLFTIGFRKVNQKIGELYQAIYGGG